MKKIVLSSSVGLFCLLAGGGVLTPSQAQSLSPTGGITDLPLSAPSLTGGVENTTPPDVPGQAGTAIPNTFWVDSHYLPKTPFMLTDTTWTVCASGCTYTNPLDAWNAALSVNFFSNAILTINISDGTYNISNQLFTDKQTMSHVHIVGDTQSPEKVILNFTNTKGTNLGGFSAYRGGQIGLIDGVTITTPIDGSGALASIDSEKRHIWNSQSYGAGVQAYGSGSMIELGSHVNISGFYYSQVADNGGTIDAPNGGVSMSIAGDVNAMARGNGVIVCTPCSATDASDYTNPNNQLGSNYDAERGGALYIDGSTGSKSLISGIVGLTGGHIWAHNTTLSGGLLTTQGQGAWITDTSSAEFTSCKISGYLHGVNVTDGGVAELDGCTIDSNYDNGVQADGGRAIGNGVTITNNKNYGIFALHQGTVVMFDTYSKMAGNGNNFGAQSAGTESSSGSVYTGSSIDVQ